MNRVLSIVVVAVALLFTSCITNEVPYPIDEVMITDVEGEGFVVGEIDYSQRIVYLDLEEQTDIESVTISSVSISDDAAELIGDVVGVHDMRSAIKVTLTKYQEYDWQIEARQDIELRFSVDGQIGSATFDTELLHAKVYIAKGADLSDVTITDLKLAADSISTYSPSIESLKNFSESFRSVYVTTHGRESQWRLYVEHSDISVALTRCDVWARIAWLEGVADISSDEEYGFRYRLASSDEWIDVDSDLIEVQSGGFSARLTGLTPSTQYEFVAYQGDELGEIVEATSGVEVQLPNSDMEDWMQDGSPWYPFPSYDDRYWDTGNKGSTTLSSSDNITTPSSDVRSGSSGQYSAQLSSRNIFKLAAGNLFVGEYKTTVGVSDGAVGFGRPFTAHPVALRFYVKYNQGVINMIGSTPAGVTIVENQTPDSGIVYIALGSWTPEKYGMSVNLTEESYGTDDVPVVVVTNDLTNTIFNPYGEDVSAYGEHIFDESITEWQEVTIPLTYTDTSINHTHIILVATSSRYGDYFTGSSSSVMYVDDFELLYE